MSQFHISICLGRQQKRFKGKKAKKRDGKHSSKQVVAEWSWHNFMSSRREAASSRFPLALHPRQLQRLKTKAHGASPNLPVFRQSEPPDLFLSLLLDSQRLDKREPLTQIWLRWRTLRPLFVGHHGEDLISASLGQINVVNDAEGGLIQGFKRTARSSPNPDPWEARPSRSASSDLKQQSMHRIG